MKLLPLQLHILLAVCASWLVAFALALLLIPRAQEATVRSNLETAGQSFAIAVETAAGAALTGDRTQLAQIVGTFLQQDPRIQYIAVGDTAGRVLASADRRPIVPLNAVSSRAAITTQPLIQRYTQDGQLLYDFARPVESNGQRAGVVQVGMSGMEIGAASGEARIRIAILGVLGLLALASVGWLWGRSLAGPFDALIVVARRAAAGELTSNIPAQRFPEAVALAAALRDTFSELGMMREQVTQAADYLESLAKELSSAVTEINAAAEEVGAVVQHIASGAQRQAAEVEETARVVDEMSASAQQIRGNAEAVRTASVRAGEIVHTSLASVLALSGKSNEIGAVTDLISHFSDQTDLLALNAAIEAARAGEYGQSFTVVADEIRRLADNSSRSVQEVVALNQEIRRLVELVRPHMDDVIASVGQTLQLAEEAHQATEHQQSLSAEMVRGVHELAGIAEANAGATKAVSASIKEQTAAMSEISLFTQEVATMAAHIRQLVQQFRRQPLPASLVAEAAPPSDGGTPHEPPSP